MGLGVSSVITGWGNLLNNISNGVLTMTLLKMNGVSIDSKSEYPSLNSTRGDQLVLIEDVHEGLWSVLRSNLQPYGY